MKLLLCVLFAAFVVIMPCEGASSPAGSAPVTYDDLSVRCKLRPMVASMMALAQVTASPDLKFIADTGFTVCTFDTELKAALKRDPRAVCTPGRTSESAADCLADFYFRHGQSATSLVITLAHIVEARTPELKRGQSKREWQLGQVEYMIRLLEGTDLSRNPAPAGAPRGEEGLLAEVVKGEEEIFRDTLDRTEKMLTRYRAPASDDQQARQSLESYAASLQARLEQQKARNWSLGT